MTGNSRENYDFRFDWASRGVEKFGARLAVKRRDVSEENPFSLSPVTRAAIATFRSFADNLEEVLLGCESGRELVEAGYREDVIVASKLNESGCTCKLVDGGIVRV